MGTILQKYLNEFRENAKKRHQLIYIICFLSCIVAGSIFWQLRLVGITMTDEACCGKLEHQHTADCIVDKTLICGKEEGVVAEGDTEPHHHTDACYQITYGCGKDEHIHTLACYSNPKVDVEAPSDWEATLPEKNSGDWRKDLVAIAQSQRAYKESTQNYEVAEDGTTKKGYSRYGEWYGNPYGDWNTMFVSFCLHYTDIPEQAVPQEAGAFAMQKNAKDLGILEDDTYAPQAGDILLLKTEKSKNTNRTAIVVDSFVDDTDGTPMLHIIQGDVNGTVAERDIKQAPTAEKDQLTLVGTINLAKAHQLADEKGLLKPATPVEPEADTENTPIPGEPAVPEKDTTPSNPATPDNKPSTEPTTPDNNGNTSSTPSQPEEETSPSTPENNLVPAPNEGDHHNLEDPFKPLVPNQSDNGLDQPSKPDSVEPSAEEDTTPKDPVEPAPEEDTTPKDPVEPTPEENTIPEDTLDPAPENGIDQPSTPELKPTPEPKPIIPPASNDVIQPLLPQKPQAALPTNGPAVMAGEPPIEQNTVSTTRAATINLFNYNQGKINHTDGNPDNSKSYRNFRFNHYDCGNPNVIPDSTYDPSIHQWLLTNLWTGFLPNPGRIDKNGKETDYTTYNVKTNPAGSTPRTGLVQSTLVDGYPVLTKAAMQDKNQEGSLAYLFDTNSVTGKTVYQDVDKLFMKDEKGYYYFNSNKNFATLNPNGNDSIPNKNAQFTVYTKPNTYAPDAADPGARFMPFNTFNVGTEGNTENPDWYFGMTVESDFIMPKDGMINGESMVFDFLGDDDVWVFIDNQLVLDLGGLHNRVGGRIDFSTGKVGVAWDYNSGKTTYNKTDTQKSLWNQDSTGIQDTVFKEKFATNTKHTFKMFYLERGATASNCAIRFNVPAIAANSLAVEKQLIKEGAYPSGIVDHVKNLDYKFRIVKANNMNESFVDAEHNTYQIWENGGPTGRVDTVDQDGYFTLRPGQTAVFPELLQYQKDKFIVQEVLPKNTNGQYKGASYKMNAAQGEAIKGTNEVIDHFTLETNPLSASESSLVQFRNRLDVTKLSTLKISKKADEGIQAPTNGYEVKVNVNGNPIPDGTSFSSDKNQEIKKSKNGIVTIDANETLTMKTGLLVEDRFTVEEVAGEGYTPSYSGTMQVGTGEATPLTSKEGATAFTGTIDAVESTATVNIHNSKNGEPPVNPPTPTGGNSLEITKTVNPGVTEPQKGFPIKVFVDKAGGNNYTLLTQGNFKVKGGTSGEKERSIQSNGIVYIHANETLSLSSSSLLSNGASFKVVEIIEQGNNYMPSLTGYIKDDDGNLINLSNFIESNLATNPFPNSIEGKFRINSTAHVDVVNLKKDGEKGAITLEKVVKENSSEQLANEKFLFDLWLSWPETEKTADVSYAVEYTNPANPSRVHENKSIKFTSKGTQLEKSSIGTSRNSKLMHAVVELYAGEKVVIKQVPAYSVKQTFGNYGKDFTNGYWARIQEQPPVGYKFLYWEQDIDNQQDSLGVSQYIEPVSKEGTYGRTIDITAVNQVESVDNKACKLKITKQVEPGVTASDQKGFPVKVKIDGRLLSSGTNALFDSSMGGTKTVNADGIVYIKAGETLTLKENLAPGTSFHVEEVDTEGKYKKTYVATGADAITQTPETGIGGTIPDNGGATAAVTITNADKVAPPPEPEPGQKESLKIAKNLVVDETTNYPAGLTGYVQTLPYSFKILKVVNGQVTDESVLEPGTAYALYKVGTNSLDGYDPGIVGYDGVLTVPPNHIAEIPNLIDKATGPFVVQEIIPEDAKGQYKGYEYSLSDATDNPTNAESQGVITTGTLNQTGDQPVSVTFKNKLDASQLSGLKITKEIDDSVDASTPFEVRISVNGSPIEPNTEFAVTQGYNNRNKAFSGVDGKVTIYPKETLLMTKGLVAGNHFQVEEIEETGDYEKTYKGTIATFTTPEVAQTLQDNREDLAGFSGQIKTPGSLAHVTIHNKKIAAPALKITKIADGIDNPPRRGYMVEVFINDKLITSNDSFVVESGKRQNQIINATSDGIVRIFDGETIVLNKDLAPKTKYRIEELKNWGKDYDKTYLSSIINADQSIENFSPAEGNNGITGTVGDKGSVSQVQIINKKKGSTENTGDLAITKKVVDADGQEQADATRFTFTVQHNKLANHTYGLEYSKGVAHANQPLTFDAKGEATVELCADETATIIGLSNEINPTITEATQEGYTPSWVEGTKTGTGPSYTTKGAIAKNKPVEVICTNTVDKIPPPEDGTVAFEFTKYEDGVPRDKIPQDGYPVEITTNATSDKQKGDPMPPGTVFEVWKDNNKTGERRVGRDHLIRIKNDETLKGYLPPGTTSFHLREPDLNGSYDKMYVGYIKDDKDALIRNFSTTRITVDGREVAGVKEDVQDKQKVHVDIFNKKYVAPDNKEVGKLKLTKKVLGAEGQLVNTGNTVFTFNITFKDSYAPEIAGKSYGVEHYRASSQGMMHQNRPITFSGKTGDTTTTATIQLYPGETASIRRLPIGAKATVTETAIPSTYKYMQWTVGSNQVTDQTVAQNEAQAIEIVHDHPSVLICTNSEILIPEATSTLEISKTVNDSSLKKNEFPVEVRLDDAVLIEGTEFVVKESSSEIRKVESVPSIQGKHRHVVYIKNGETLELKQKIPAHTKVTVEEINAPKDNAGSEATEQYNQAYTGYIKVGESLAQNLTEAPGKNLISGRITQADSTMHVDIVNSTPKEARGKMDLTKTVKNSQDIEQYPNEEFTFDVAMDKPNKVSNKSYILEFANQQDPTKVHQNRLVKFNDAGKLTGSQAITLHPGETATLSHLPVGDGLTPTITENGAEAYETSWSGTIPETTVKTQKSVKGNLINQNTPGQFVCTNTMQTGELSLTKKVDGLSSPEGTAFTFTIDVAEADKQSVSGNSYNVSYSGGSSSHTTPTTITFNAQGQATVKLYADEKATITGLPIGVTPTITETKQAGYNPTWEGDVTTTAPTLTVTTKPITTKPVDVTCTNTYTGGYELPETGGFGTAGYTLGGLALMLLSLFEIYTRKRKKGRRGKPS